MLGLLGLAMALALQDVLSSLVAGTMLAFQRPFRDGDQIRTADFEGTVEDVTLRAVTMRTFDGVRVFIPNLTVWEEPIVNYTTLGTRRTDLVVGVGYESDLDAVQELLVTSVASREGVLADPAPEAFVKEFGDSSVNFLVLFWHGPHIAEEWSARDAVMRGIKRDFDAAGIEIPLPQRVMSFKHPESADDELLPGKGEPGHASDGQMGR
ncbi:MAG: mechanosensitive ion channel family protein [Armatimonadetes bacterium]|nr:MAG: mechanosensitive ion channel family protein [Armatimonadota bacterium]